MAGMLLLGGSGVTPSVPTQPQPDEAVASYFERFDGLGQPPLLAPATSSAEDTTGEGQVYGFDQLGRYPRPGAVDQPVGQVYTPGPLIGATGVVGGEPLPVGDWKFPLNRGYTRAKAPGIQWRLGQGGGMFGHGPSSLGAANTVALANITNNPPQPTELDLIISGQG
jgi:hypothetical protein